MTGTHDTERMPLAPQVVTMNGVKKADAAPQQKVCNVMLVRDLTSSEPTLLFAARKPDRSTGCVDRRAHFGCDHSVLDQLVRI